MSHSNMSADVEKDAAFKVSRHLTNHSVQSFSWENVTATVRKKTSRRPINILSGINGIVHGGEILALMGPR
jgi:hypothetical protein